MPVIADARDPEAYLEHIDPGTADVVYQDVAQKNQMEILLKNGQALLKKNGYGLLMVKARSIDVASNPKKIFRAVEKELGKHYDVVENILLRPYEMDHCAIAIKNRSE